MRLKRRPWRRLLRWGGGQRRRGRKVGRGCVQEVFTKICTPGCLWKVRLRVGRNVGSRAKLLGGR